MKIKIMPFLSRKGNQLGKGAIEFDSDILIGFQLVGFTICDSDKGLYVQFPASIVKDARNPTGKPYFFLRPATPELLDKLEERILDVYESMVGKSFNSPRVSEASTDHKYNVESIKKD